MTQTEEDATSISSRRSHASSSASSSRRQNNGSIKLPFEGLTFFTSGVPNNIQATIKRLGGSILNDIGEKWLKPQNAFNRLFFVSTPEKRRTHKYLLAGALGVPMMHVSWVKSIRALQEEHEKHGTNDPPYPFNSELYTAHRLPLGLSNDTGLFVLQRARYAKKWSRPGQQHGSGAAVFNDLNVAVSLPKVDMEKKWGEIIKALGGCVVSHADLKKSDVNIVLLDSVSLPPHETAAPERVSRTINLLRNRNSRSGSNVLFVDLSWVTQCIVQRTRVDLSGNGNRYRVSIDPPSSSGGGTELHSLRKDCGNAVFVRYEVGDAVRFQRRKDAPSTIGRIISVHHDGARRKNTLEVKLLEKHNDRELMEGGDDVPTVRISEDQLRHHVVVLSRSDYATLSNEWRNGSDAAVFKLRRSK